MIIQSNNSRDILYNKKVIMQLIKLMQTKESKNKKKNMNNVIQTNYLKKMNNKD